MEEKEIELTRAEMYERVWSMPTTQVALQFNLSDSAIGKIYKKHEIPKPPVGYWNKYYHGKDGPRTQLRPASRPEPERILITVAPDVEANLSEDARGLLEAERSSGAKIFVEDRLRKPHPLVAATRKELARGVTQDGLVSRGGDARPSLDVTVAPESINRACLILDALVKTLIERGFSVLASPVEFGTSTGVVVVNGQEVPFRIKERLREARPRSPKKDHSRTAHRRLLERRVELIPTGRLKLEITGQLGHGVRRSWSDGAEQRVEDCLNDFVLSVIRLADQERAIRVKHSERKLRAMDQWMARAREKQRRSEEQQRVEELMQQAQSWRRAEDIRAFVAAVAQGRTFKSHEEMEE